jgi:hypothetical protein
MRRLLLVALFVSASACGSSSDPPPFVISPGPLPTPTTGSVSFEVSPSAPRAGQEVTFSLTWTDTDPAAVRLTIVDFGDDSLRPTYLGAPSKISHTFASPGTFTVLLVANAGRSGVVIGHATVVVTN